MNSAVEVDARPAEGALFTLKFTISCVVYTEIHDFLTENDDFIGCVLGHALLYYVSRRSKVH